MAGKFTKSWSFFGPRRPQSEDYLGCHYQPSTPNSRINLQQRFSEGKGPNGGWRRGPLPPPPTQLDRNGPVFQQPERLTVKPMPRFSSFDFNRLSGQSHYANVEDCQSSGHTTVHHDKSPRGSTLPRGSRLPRRPLQDLPSGVAPIWNNIQDNVSQLKPQTSKIWQEGGRKMNRAIQGVRTSISSFTQLFRSSTRRRYKLDGGTPTHQTPRRTPNRSQTPGKMYSPFDISTPRTPHSYNKAPKRLQAATPRRIYSVDNRAMVRTPQQNTSRTPRDTYQWAQFHSPSQNFKRDVTSAQQGVHDFQHVGNRIVNKNMSGRWTRYR